ncbi:SDR family NAD(P)-dependent oxidoreductase [Halopseudomonas pachastrellae]|nr:SDR family NAD(P)-dependent oxidoreductase [Halopseudomonas pachastrellae]
MPSVMIAGCGDVGSEWPGACWLKAVKVYGLRRDTAALPRRRGAGGGRSVCSRATGRRPAQLDYMVYLPGGGQRARRPLSAPVRRGAAHALSWLGERKRPLRHLLQVSSSGVYAQQAGEWVTENSPALADSGSASALLAAEDVALRSGHPASVVRLTGIYGPGRNRLIEQARAGMNVPAEPPQYTNRIHRDDAAGLLAHLLLQVEAARAAGPLLPGCGRRAGPLARGGRLAAAAARCQPPARGPDQHPRG